MATGFREAHRLLDDVDYSVSHRTVMPPPPPPPPPISSPSPTHQQQQQQQQHPPPPSVVEDGGLIGAYTAAGTHFDPQAIGIAHSGPLPNQSLLHQQQHHHHHHQPPQPQANTVATEVTRQHESQQQPPLPPSHTHEKQQSSSGSTRKRGNSFSFLRRTATSTSSSSTKINLVPAAHTTDPTAPPLPNTLISQATADAALRKQSIDNHGRRKSSSAASHHPTPNSSAPAVQQPNTPPLSDNSFFGYKTRARSGSWRRAGGGESTMLRKSSRLAKQQAEADRQAAASLPRQPPQLPTFDSAISSFDEGRPDSVTIFSNAYTLSNGPVPRTTANFSRPAMAPSSNFNSSSSPVYAVRSPSGVTNSSSPPDVRAAKASGEYVTDLHHDRAESMTNRGRYSYASSVGQVNSVSSPRRVRRRKDPTPFNVLVIGAKNSGKTSFISFLNHSLALPMHSQPSGHGSEPQVGGNRSSFTSHYIETEMDGERVGLTLWDSPGLEKNIVDLQLREMAAFVEAKFEDTFLEEQKVVRSPGVKDTHIHCVFLILDPVRLDATIAASTASNPNASYTGSLDDDLDLQVMRTLWGKTTVIPVISKADTLTVGHMSFLKRAVWKSLKGAMLDPLKALELDEDEDEDEEGADGEDAEDYDSEAADDFPVPKARKPSNHKRQSSLSAMANGTASDDEPPYIPMSILSPDVYELPPYVPKSEGSKPGKVGRRFPWGFADPHDPEHCDFGRLRDSIFSEWRSELRELSRTKWYENWRTSRLKTLPGSRQRIKGGVTPVAAVPKEGRMAGAPTRQLSPPTGIALAPSAASLGAAASSIPRTVSVTSSNAPQAGMANLNISGDNLRTVSGASQATSVRRQ